MLRPGLAGNFKPAAGNSTSIFGRESHDLNLAGVGMGLKRDLNAFRARLGLDESGRIYLYYQHVRCIFPLTFFALWTIL